MLIYSLLHDTLVNRAGKAEKSLWRLPSQKRGGTGFWLFLSTYISGLFIMIYALTKHHSLLAELGLLLNSAVPYWNGINSAAKIQKERILFCKMNMRYPH